MKKFFVAACCMAILLFAFSCKKVAGPGGTSTIKGTIYVDTFFLKKDGSVISTNVLLGNLNVYLCYGDDQISSTNTSTSYNGQYKFDYLTKGNYSVYVIGDEYYSNIKQAHKIATVTISANKQVVTASDLHINVGY